MESDRSETKNIGGNRMTAKNRSFESFRFAGMALDPIHVGTGGSRLGRVDNTIVRDPVTRIPKIPGSSLAGVLRAYAAMAIDGKYPGCAGQGQTASDDGAKGHCCEHNCEVCTVFGYAKGRAGDIGGFAGLAAFSDMHVLFFPVGTRIGPMWITCPGALREMGAMEVPDVPDANTLYLKEPIANDSLNLGWILLPARTGWNFECLSTALDGLNIPEFIAGNPGVVSDKLFGHIANGNLEVRTSVAIDPTTGAAEDRKLFSYEAIPRSTVLTWEVTCRNPGHFNSVQAVKSPEEVRAVVAKADPYLEHLGIGGMGSRGMGRLRVLGFTNGVSRNAGAGGEA
jgi:CRISPR-associated protein Cmr4